MCVTEPRRPLQPGGGPCTQSTGCGEGVIRLPKSRPSLCFSPADAGGRLTLALPGKLGRCRPELLPSSACTSAPYLRPLGFASEGSLLSLVCRWVGCCPVGSLWLWSCSQGEHPGEASAVLFALTYAVAICVFAFLCLLVS